MKPEYRHFSAAHVSLKVLDAELAARPVFDPGKTQEVPMVVSVKPNPEPEHLDFQQEFDPTTSIPDDIYLALAFIPYEDFAPGIFIQFDPLPKELRIDGEDIKESERLWRFFSTPHQLRQYITTVTGYCIHKLKLASTNHQDIAETAQRVARKMVEVSRRRELEKDNIHVLPINYTDMETVEEIAEVAMLCMMQLQLRLKYPHRVLHLRNEKREVELRLPNLPSSAQFADEEVLRASYRIAVHCIKDDPRFSEYVGNDHRQLWENATNENILPQQLNETLIAQFSAISEFVAPQHYTNEPSSDVVPQYRIRAELVCVPEQVRNKATSTMEVPTIDPNSTESSDATTTQKLPRSEDEDTAILAIEEREAEQIKPEKIVQVELRSFHLGEIPPFTPVKFSFPLHTATENDEEKNKLKLVESLINAAHTRVLQKSLLFSPKTTIEYHLHGESFWRMYLALLSGMQGLSPEIDSEAMKKWFIAGLLLGRTLNKTQLRSAIERVLTEEEKQMRNPEQLLPKTLNTEVWQIAELFGISHGFNSTEAGAELETVETPVISIARSSTNV